jgi:hypothetical protein
MSHIALADVRTARPHEVLGELCEHLTAKSQVRPEMRVELRATPEVTEIDFGWASCRIRVQDRTLLLEARADDPTGLDAMTEFLRRHLEGLEHEGLEVTWRRPGQSEGPQNHAQRRDSMRHFHRVMRH